MKKKKTEGIHCVEVVFDNGDALMLHEFYFSRLAGDNGYSFKGATKEISVAFDGTEYVVLINWEKVTHIREVSCGSCNETPSKSHMYL